MPKTRFHKPPKLVRDPLQSGGIRIPIVQVRPPHTLRPGQSTTGYLVSTGSHIPSLVCKRTTFPTTPLYGPSSPNRPTATSSICCVYRAPSPRSGPKPNPGPRERALLRALRSPST